MLSSRGGWLGSLMRIWSKLKRRKNVEGVGVLGVCPVVGTRSFHLFSFLMFCFLFLVSLLKSFLFSLD